MTTHEAFAGLVGSRYFWKSTGESENLRRWYRHQLQHDHPVLLDTKVRLLAKAGFVEVPASWSQPSVRAVTEQP
jgi:hypothetical protein